jgi:hypothetical protein
MDAFFSGAPVDYQFVFCTENELNTRFCACTRVTTKSYPITRIICFEQIISSKLSHKKQICQWSD